MAWSKKHIRTGPQTWKNSSISDGQVDYRLRRPRRRHAAVCKGPAFCVPISTPRAGSFSKNDLWIYREGARDKNLLLITPPDNVVILSPTAPNFVCSSAPFSTGES